MLKVLHVAAPTIAGGLERVVEGLAVGHRRRGHTIGAVILVPEGGADPPLVEALAAAAVDVRTVSLPPRAYWSERREVRRVCQAFGPDVVHTHGFRTDIVDRPVAAGLGIATVTTVHGPSLQGGLKGAFYEWLQRRSYRRFDAVVAVSAALHAETLADGVASERLHLIPNAWSGLRPPLSRTEARHELDLPAEGHVVGWVGRMIHVKGGDLFVEAVRRLPRNGTVFAMIGYGEEAEELRARAASVGLGDRIRFYPGVADAGRLFTAFDTYVLSSRSEGLPIVILEAMAAGTPIVATRVGGLPEVLSENEAWLVPPDDADALARALHQSLTDRGEAISRAKRARERLDRDFALEPWLDRYEALYRRVAADRSPPATRSRA